MWYSYLKDNGFSNTHMERMMRYYPNLFSYSIKKQIEPKLSVFQDLRFSAGEIADIIASKVSILNYREERIISSVSALKGLLGSRGLVELLRKRSGDCFFIDVKKRLLPNIEFLKSSGVST